MKNIFTAFLFITLLYKADAVDLLTPEAARHLAEENSESLKTYSLELKKSRLESSGLKYDWYPDISLTGSLSSSLSESDTTQSSSASLAVSQQIWDGGSYSTEKKIAQAEIESTGYDLETSLFEVRKECDRFYYNYLEAFSQQGSAKTALEASNALLDISLEKYSNNAISKISYLEIKAETAARETDFIKAESAARSAEAELISFLGIEFLPPLPRFENFTDGYLINLLNSISDEAKYSAGDILSAKRIKDCSYFKKTESSLKTAELNKELIKKEYNPSVSLSLNNNITGTDNTTGLTHTLAGTVSSTFSISKWDKKNKLSQAQADIEISRLDKDDTIKSYQLEITNAWLEICTAAETITSQKKALEYEEEYYEELKTRYSLMAENFSNLKEAESDLADARSEYISGICSYLINISELIYLLEFDDEKELEKFISTEILKQL